MGQALYRKYRSKSLPEIVGQEHITKTLNSAVKQGRISHAYLFTGPKGVGKTSVARILAHEINGLKYVDDTGHIDIIEIDAASNRKLEETKSLIEKIYVAPVTARYKVYIIDEVHMLTPESFNALLKTLEEPPEHAVFILATTEAHKLPETIVSRTQRFQFKPIDQSKIAKHLKYIAEQEKIKVDLEALELIAAHGQGSFRDSIGLLDQAANYGQPITIETVTNLLGIPPKTLLDQLYSDLTNTNSARLMKDIHNLFDQGYPATAIASQLSDIIRSRIISNDPHIDQASSLNLLEKLLDIPASTQPERLLEIVLLASLPKSNNKAMINEDRPETDKNVLRPTEKSASSQNQQPTPSVNDKPVPKSDLLISDAMSPTAWTEVLNLLKSRFNTLYGVVRMASVDYSDPSVLQLNFAFPFHQKRVNEAHNRKLIEDAIEQVIGMRINIKCNIDKSLLTPNQKDTEPQEIDTIAEVFGGVELLD